jgi:multicomponent Na+:H+ antiporter subunit E
MTDGAGRLLVPVADSATLRNTVAYAISEAVAAAGVGPDSDLPFDSGPQAETDDGRAQTGSGSGAGDSPDSGPDPDPDPDSADADDGPRPGDRTPAVHFVYLAGWRDEDPGTAGRRQQAVDLLDQVEVWARYDLDDAEASDAVGVETALLGGDSYLFGPDDFVGVLDAYAAEHALDRVVIDPEYAFAGRNALAQPIENELRATGIAVTRAPVERPTRHARVVREATPARFAAVFAGSFLFYTILAGGLNAFDLVTGAVTAAVVATALSSVSLDNDPTLRETPRRIARWAVYAPVLLFEIVRANVVVAAVILDPRREIEPRLVRVRSLVGSGLPVTTLANSITLTPGTLTVRASDRDLYVHALTASTRQGLIEGSLERWTRFVFYGRSAARIPSPDERGDVELLQDPGGEDARSGGGTADVGGDEDAGDAGDAEAVADGSGPDGPGGPGGAGR